MALLAADALVLVIALWLAYVLRFDFALPEQHWQRFLRQVPAVIGIQLVAIFLCRIPLFVWRYISLREVSAFARAAAFAMLPMLVLRIALPETLQTWRVPLSVILVDSLLAFGGLLGIRVVRRLVYERRLRRGTGRGAGGRLRRVVLFGAGRGGVLAAREIRTRTELPLKVVGFVDDDPLKQGMIIQGLRVMGMLRDLPRLAVESGIEEVIMTIAEPSAEQLRRFEGIFQAAGLRARAIPRFYQLLTGDVRTDRFRHVLPEELLARDPVSVDATPRLRQRVTKGAGNRTRAPTMAFKLLEMAQQQWRRLEAAHLPPLVRAGVTVRRWRSAQTPQRRVGSEGSRLIMRSGSTTLDNISAPSRSRVYVSPPHMAGDEIELMQDAFESNWITSLGPHVEAFEKEIAAQAGVRSALALCSGTAALHLALCVLGIEREDIVICSSLTFVATANPILYQGAIPVFVDSDEVSWNMDPDLLEHALRTLAARGQRPRAVVVADVFGQCADYTRIKPICEEHGVPLIEDAAQALGAVCAGQPAGRFGRAGMFSFNGNKIITTSGGGMLVSDDASFIEQARMLSTQARDPAPYYEHSRVGYNYRLSNLLAALGRGQLCSLEDFVRRRRQIFRRYEQDLLNLPGVGFMPEASYGRSTRWLTCLTIEPEAFGATQEEIRLALEAQDIEARPVWKPLHLQPLFEGCQVFGGDVSARLFERGLCLPSGSALDISDQERIIDVIRSSCRGR